MITQIVGDLEGKVLLQVCSTTGVFTAVDLKYPSALCFNKFGMQEPTSGLDARAAAVVMRSTFPPCFASKKTCSTQLTKNQKDL